MPSALAMKIWKSRRNVIDPPLPGSDACAVRCPGTSPGTATAVAPVIAARMADLRVSPNDMLSPVVAVTTGAVITARSVTAVQRAVEGPFVPGMPPVRPGVVARWCRAERRRVVGTVKVSVYWETSY